MKKFILPIALGIILSGNCQAFTSNEDTKVNIAIDSLFKDKNIIFNIDNKYLPETIGVYKAGDSLMLNALVPPTYTNDQCVPSIIRAYVTDNTNQTMLYNSRSAVCFASNGWVGLSFPAMFERVN